MKRVKLAVCDQDRMYCSRLCEYLRDNLELSFDIHSFTDAIKLREFSERNPVKLLVISEETLGEIDSPEIGKSFPNIIVLDEESCSQAVAEGRDNPHRRYVSKFLPASEIRDSVIDLCMDIPEDFSELGVKRAGAGCKVIGFYTPLSRSGQTSLAISMGELLAREKKTIFLSFESFSSLPDIIGCEPESDITDLLYYSDCERDKFCLYLEKIKLSRNGLDYVAPARTSLQVRELRSSRVMDLVELLSGEAGYENIIMDLKEYPEDFFEVLSLCDVIYTLNRNTGQDQYRMGRYNQILAQNGYEDILSKTVKCHMPGYREPSQAKELAAALLGEGKEGMNSGD